MHYPIKQRRIIEDMYAVRHKTNLFSITIPYTSKCIYLRQNRITLNRVHLFGLDHQLHLKDLLKTTFEMECVWLLDVMKKSLAVFWSCLKMYWFLGIYTLSHIHLHISEHFVTLMISFMTKKIWWGGGKLKKNARHILSEFLKFLYSLIWRDCTR